MFITMLFLLDIHRKTIDIFKYIIFSFYLVDLEVDGAIVFPCASEADTSCESTFHRDFHPQQIDSGNLAPFVPYVSLDELVSCGVVCLFLM